MTVARFDPTGKHVFIGTSSGSVLVFNTRTKSVRYLFETRELSTLTSMPKMVARHKITGAGVMRGLDFAKSGR